MWSGSAERLQIIIYLHATMKLLEHNSSLYANPAPKGHSLGKRGYMHRQASDAPASEYLGKCEASLEKCEELGFLKSDADQLDLMNDETFRDRVSIFARYSPPVMLVV